MNDKKLRGHLSFIEQVRKLVAHPELILEGVITSDVFENVRQEMIAERNRLS